LRALGGWEGGQPPGLFPKPLALMLLSEETGPGVTLPVAVHVPGIV